MKRVLSLSIATVMLLTQTACGNRSDANQKEGIGLDKLVSEYGFQWTDPDAPILNDAGAEAISFHIYSSKNASSVDYNDMKIMKDL